MRTIVLGTAGHIDHGKSALVRALTGIDPDRLVEERVRGITIDLGFAHLALDGVTVALVDVPGHERFVKNMLAGATGIDGVLFVVAADESVMPQTREHFDICRLLDVRGGVVVLTKADLVDADTLDLVRLEVRDLVAGSFLDDAPVVAVSSRTGAGLDELRRAIAALAAHVPARDDRGAVRLPIDRVFSVKGFGTVVTGTVVSGGLGVDDELVALPRGRRVKVRGLQAHGAVVERGVAGQRLAVNVAGVEIGDLARGDVLVSPGTFEPTTRVDAVLAVIAAAKPLRHGTRVRVHAGTSEILGRVAVALRGDEAIDDAAPAAIQPGAEGYVRLRMETPAVLTRGDHFILRSYSPATTIAGGRVLDPHPARGGIRSAAGRARLARLDPRDRSTPDPVIVQMLSERGAAGLRVADLVGRVGLGPAAASAAARRLEVAGEVVSLGDAIVGTTAVTDLEARLLAAVGVHHRTQPRSDGWPREEARERLFQRAHPALFDLVLHRLSAAGRLVARDRLLLPTHQVSLSSDEARIADRVAQAWLDAGLRPPELGRLATELSLAPEALEAAVRWLQRQRTLVKVDTLWFHAGALDRLKHEVIALKHGGATPVVDVTAFKERYGITRKYAIPLLEYLDRERVTRRVGDTRVVL